MRYATYVLDLNDIKKILIARSSNYFDAYRYCPDVRIET